MKTERFWLEDPKSLFNDIKILPKYDMSVEKQMNCITRFIILVFIILYFINYKQSTLFLILSLFFIIILYYLQKSKMTTRENFNYRNNYIEKTQQLYDDFVCQPRYTPQKFPSYYNQQFEKPVEIRPDQTYRSYNQELVGGANPKTKIRPVVAPPSHAWEYWKENDFVFPSTINDRSVQDYYNSGYYIDQPIQDSNKPKNIKENYTYEYYKENPKKQEIKERYNFNYNGTNSTNVLKNNTNNYMQFSEGDSEEKSCKSCSGGVDISQLPSKGKTMLNKDSQNFTKFDEKAPEKIIRYTGDIDDACGYDETNLQYNLPTNYSSTNCERTTKMSDLNKQIFTSTIIPGTYYKNDIIEPLNSNIGISFTQQIPPRKVSYDKYGNKILTGMDPRLYTPEPNEQKVFDIPSNFDVYDPRTNGYGTSNRCYTDKLTGQPRFYYDDVESIRRPNYIARSDIDFLDDADTYGPIKSYDEEIDINEKARKEAETAYTDNTLEFRTEMMTRLMRKRNAELWQRRIAPLAGNKK
jgi:hypothetical protein